MSRMIEHVNRWWKAEATRHFLWVPACFAAGIALYYGLPTEPETQVLRASAIALSLLTWALRRHALPLLMALTLMALGVNWAQFRTLEHHPVMIQESLKPRWLEGRVRDIERTQAGVRLLLEKVRVEDLPPEKTPAQVRLSVKFKKDATFELPPIGTLIHIRAGLMPPMGPALPNGFDFARYFYFREIGAVGFGLPPWEVMEAEAEPQTFQNRFWSWRANLTDRIVRELGPETGGIAAGLITGDARAIRDADFDALRASNLYHIIAISGEHMVIISGVIFVGLRLLMLLLPRRYNLRPEGKPIAAAITLALVTVYLFVTGLPTSAVRAYVMIALVLLAVILRRHIDPMRSLAITALAMLLYDPAMLLDPGFQLSFAATLAIIALVEARVMTPPPMLERGPVRRTLYHLATLIMVSVVAEAATAPFVISMFNNMSPYGVLANSLATPLVSLFLMPVVALFFILLPLGLESIALALLNLGIEALLALSRWVAALPHARWFIPSPPDWGLACFALGLLWICLWRTSVRRWGILAILAGIASFKTLAPPDLLAGSSLKQMAFRSEEGYVLARGKRNSMIAELWANGLGYAELPKAEKPQWQCDKSACIATVKHKEVALLKPKVKITHYCTSAAIILTTEPDVGCEEGADVIDGSMMPAGSVAALWINEKGTTHYETSADWQGERPWSVASGEEEGEGD